MTTGERETVYQKWKRGVDTIACLGNYGTGGCAYPHLHDGPCDPGPIDERLERARGRVSYLKEQLREAAGALSQLENEATDEAPERGEKINGTGDKA